MKRLQWQQSRDLKNAHFSWNSTSGEGKKKEHWAILTHSRKVKRDEITWGGKLATVPGSIAVCLPCTHSGFSPLCVLSLESHLEYQDVLWFPVNYGYLAQTGFWHSVSFLSVQDNSWGQTVLSQDTTIHSSTCIISREPLSFWKLHGVLLDQEQEEYFVVSCMLCVSPGGWYKTMACSNKSSNWSGTTSC